MAYLPWIADTHLESEVIKILQVAENAIKMAENEFNRNVIDPFSIAFEMAGFNLEGITQWERSERARKAQKTLSNSFGMFHQNIIGHVPGWENLGTGNSADVRNNDQKIIAELKNKHNTIKGSDQVTVYDHLQELVMPISSVYKGYTSYLVEIIPKPKDNKPQAYNIPFTPSDNSTSTKKPANELIRKIDGVSFYALVTESKTALFDLYQVLPKVIHKVSSNQKEFDEQTLTKMQWYFQKAFATIS